MNHSVRILRTFIVFQFRVAPACGIDTSFLLIHCDFGPDVLRGRQRPRVLPARLFFQPTPEGSRTADAPKFSGL